MLRRRGGTGDPSYGRRTGCVPGHDRDARFAPRIAFLQRARTTHDKNSVTYLRLVAAAVEEDAVTEAVGHDVVVHVALLCPKAQSDAVLAPLVEGTFESKQGLAMAVVTQR